MAAVSCHLTCLPCTYMTLDDTVVAVAEHQLPGLSAPDTVTSLPQKIWPVLHGLHMLPGCSLFLLTSVFSQWGTGLPLAQDEKCVCFIQGLAGQ